MGYSVDIRRYLTNDSLYISVDGCICLEHDSVPAWHSFSLSLQVEVTFRRPPLDFTLRGTYEIGLGPSLSCYLVYFHD